jgi:hypothetical protein
MIKTLNTGDCMESQNHGFVFENIIVDAITGSKNDSYTGIFDIPKVDSKNQRRVQCSCKIKDLYSSSIPITEYTEEFHGIKLPYVIQSTKRF